MSRDDLKQLLRTADAHAPAAPLTNDLAARVHQRLARRRQRQATAAALGVFVLVGLAVFASLRDDRSTVRDATTGVPPTTAVNPTSRKVPATAAIAADFAVTATLHELTAQKLLTTSAHAAADRREARPSSPVDAQFFRDRAALVLVYDADRDVRENRPATARARYRRAIELFPHTHWAQVARQRLKEIQT